MRRSPRTRCRRTAGCTPSPDCHRSALRVASCPPQHPFRPRPLVDHGDWRVVHSHPHAFCGPARCRHRFVPARNWTLNRNCPNPYALPDAPLSPFERSWSGRLRDPPRGRVHRTGLLQSDYSSPHSNLPLPRRRTSDLAVELTSPSKSLSHDDSFPRGPCRSHDNCRAPVKARSELTPPVGLTAKAQRTVHTGCRSKPLDLSR
ncbi:hypothetical protein C8Q77DRAFT_1150812 [Trametes polyzona]|nr:hypothetical protein C8Q77DRAFT_1150812 [Trametes polyzona]